MTMSVRTTTIRLIDCAQCGEALHLPEWSEYPDQNSVRHLWKCEACDYAFETKAWYDLAVA